jgi:hypothetical protein
MSLFPTMLLLAFKQRLAMSLTALLFVLLGSIGLLYPGHPPAPSSSQNQEQNNVFRRVASSISSPGAIVGLTFGILLGVMAVLAMIAAVIIKRRVEQPMDLSVLHISRPHSILEEVLKPEGSNASSNRISITDYPRIVKPCLRAPSPLSPLEGISPKSSLDPIEANLQLSPPNSFSLPPTVRLPRLSPHSRPYSRGSCSSGTAINAINSVGNQCKLRSCSIRW